MLRARIYSSLPNLNDDGEYPTPVAPPNTPWSYRCTKQNLSSELYTLDAISKCFSWDSCLNGVGCNATPLSRCRHKMETPVTRSLQEQPNSVEKQQKALESVNDISRRKDNYPQSLLEEIRAEEAKPRAPNRVLMREVRRE
ncbi:unnamed protein product [Trichobilharzia szidati]|nr:unnamed protein product [Trichobilharzia szidati]